MGVVFMKTWEAFKQIQPIANQIMTNSIRKNRISHAYLIQGSRGTGKKELAKLFAKTLFCKNRFGMEPCQQCNRCKRIESGNHPDVHWIEPDGQTIKIDQIRQLQSEFIYSGLESERKVYVMIGTETLTLNAANRLLKFLEEPNPKTTALLLTENRESIIPTILSRCQLIDLQPQPQEEFQKELEAYQMSKQDTLLLSELTKDIDEALSFYEDEWFQKAKKLAHHLINILIDRPADVFLYIHNHWMPHFKERDLLDQGLELLLIAFRDVLYYHIDNHESIVFFAQDEELLKEAVIHFPKERLIVILQRILKAKRKNRQNVHPVLVMEQLVLYI